MNAPRLAQQGRLVVAMAMALAGAAGAHAEGVGGFTTHGERYLHTLADSGWIPLSLQTPVRLDELGPGERYLMNLNAALWRPQGTEDAEQALYGSGYVTPGERYLADLALVGWQPAGVTFDALTLALGAATAGDRYVMQLDDANWRPLMLGPGELTVPPARFCPPDGGPGVRC